VATTVSRAPRAAKPETPLKLGTAAAASTPMTIITTVSSSRVKPR
jgi:hypothetical protein